MRKVLVSCLLAVSWLVSASARAQTFPTNDPRFANGSTLDIEPSNLFGTKGQIVITGDFKARLDYDQVSLSGKTVSTTAIEVIPSLDFFVANNFAVGGMVGVGYVDSAATSTSATSLLIGPAVGYNIRVNPRASIFPRLSAAYTHFSGTREFSVAGLSGKTDSSGWDVTVMLRAPFLFHPFQHFFLGFGPYVSRQLVAKAGDTDLPEHTRFGLSFDIGGWF